MFYSTSFVGTEDPISESGVWLNGAAVGIDWADCQKYSGHATGTVVNSPSPPFNDSTAILTGTWNASQRAKAVVKKTISIAGDDEVELRLNSSISAHICNGYEFDYGIGSVTPFVAIVRWNGALNDFTTLAQVNSTPLINDGDILLATSINGVLSAYINGVLITSVSDSTFSNGGNPGMGFWETGPISELDSYGFYSFEAQDYVAAPDDGLSITFSNRGSSRTISSY